MSMLSAQIDELREMADDIESRYGYPTAVNALRDAADTIWQLRDDLQRANAENAKLRELVRQMHPRAKAFLQMGVQLGCNDTLSYDWELQMCELGVEVSDGN